MLDKTEYVSFTAYLTYSFKLLHVILYARLHELIFRIEQLTVDHLSSLT